MKKSLRWGAAVATAAVATLTLASCGFSGGSGGSSGGAQTLDLMVASYSDNTKAEWQQIIKDFEAKNSDIKVNLDVESWTDINNVIKTQHPGRQAARHPEHRRVRRLRLRRPALPGEGHRLGVHARRLPGRLQEERQHRRHPVRAPVHRLGARACSTTRTTSPRPGSPRRRRRGPSSRRTPRKLKAAGVTPYGMPLGSEEAQAETAIWFYGAGGGYGDAKKLTIDSPENVDGRDRDAEDHRRRATPSRTPARPTARRC